MHSSVQSFIMSSHIFLYLPSIRFPSTGPFNSSKSMLLCLPFLESAWLVVGDLPYHV